MNRTKILPLSLVLALFTGCETVSSTKQFYRPLTSNVYPPKPKDYPIPVLGAAPNRKFVAIGRLSFSAGHGYNYMIRAIEFNARQAGGDAAIMVDSSSSAQQYTYQVPGYTTQQPVTTYSSGQATANYYGSGGYGYGSAYGSGTSTTYVPVYHPGYTGVGTAVRHNIDAVIIKYQ